MGLVVSAGAGNSAHPAIAYLPWSSASGFADPRSRAAGKGCDGGLKLSIPR